MKISNKWQIDNKSQDLLSDFVDIEFRMETTAILSIWNNIFFFVKFFMP